MAGLNLRPRRTWGQNFLASESVLDDLLQYASIEKHADVLEVGPGLGVVTGMLIECAGQVTAVEKDHRLAAYLRVQFKDRANLKLLTGDALDVGTIDYAARRYDAFVSCLPYSIGGRILVHLLHADAIARRYVITIQKEVADRITAAPGSKDYGPLAIWSQRLCRVERKRLVRPGSFWPKPDVTSAVVVLDRRERPVAEVSDDSFFYGLTGEVFRYRRKRLPRAVAHTQGPWRVNAETTTSLLAELGIDIAARAEDLTIAEWCAFSDRMMQVIGTEQGAGGATPDR